MLGFYGRWGENLGPIWVFLALSVVVSGALVLIRPEWSPGVLVADSIAVEVVHASIATTVQYIPWLITAALVLVMTWGRRSRSSRLANVPDSTTVVGLALVYTAWVALVALVHLPTGDARYAMGVPVVMAVLFWALPRIMRDQRESSAFLQLLAVTAVSTALLAITAGIAALVGHVGFPVPVGHRILRAWQWPFANKNTLGFLAAFGVPAALAMGLLQPAGRRWGWWIIFGVSVVGLGMSYARTGWIAAVVGVVVLAMGFGRWRGVLSVVGVAVVAGGLLVLKTGVHRIEALWGHGLSGRGGLWQAALTVARHHLWVGVGPGNSPAAMAPLVAAAYRGLTPHNALLETLVELGLPGLILFLGVVVAAFAKAWSRAETSSIGWAWIALLLAGLTEQMAESGFLGGISFEDYLFAALLAAALTWRGAGIRQRGVRRWRR